MPENKLKDWLSNTICGLVSDPEKVQIKEVKDDMGLLFEIEVSKEDLGKVIGKKGQHAAALRTLLRCAGSLYDERAALKINSINESV